MTPTRAEPLPDLPTIGEQGYKEFEYVTWFGIVAPAKTPEQAARQLRDWFAAARQAPEAKARLAAQGLFPEKECGDDYAALMRKEYETYGRIIREANIKAE
jgi:tripartite-type tricarboxylate transporter receptor subunit TctC